jgi:hypothetical protein
MSKGEFDHNFLKTFISWLKTKDEEDLKTIMTTIAFEMATIRKNIKDEVIDIEEKAPINTVTTGRKISDYIRFKALVHPLLKKKHPKFTPQQIMTEEGRLWQLKKKDSSLTIEQLVGVENIVPVPEPEPIQQALTVLPTKLIVKRPKRKIPKHVRQQVWNEYIGAELTRYKCTCCNKTLIDISTFEVGHVVAEANGGDETIKNLRPICGGCNRGMGTTDMREFSRKHFGRELGF